MKVRWLCEEFDDSVGGGGGGTTTLDEGQWGDAAGDVGEGEGAGVDEGRTAAPQVPAFDMNQFAQVLGSQLRQAVVPQQEQPQPMSDEEFHKATHYYKAESAKMKELLNPDATDEQRAEVFHQMMENYMKHILSVSALAQNYMSEDINGRLAPLLQDRVRSAESKFSDVVVGKYPQLKEQKQLVGMAIQHLRSAGFRPTSQDHAVATVAQVIESIVKPINPQFSLAGGRQGNGNMPQVAQHMSGPGAGGHGSGANKGTQKPTWMNAFHRGKK